MTRIFLCALSLAAFVYVCYLVCRKRSVSHPGRLTLAVGILGRLRWLFLAIAFVIGAVMGCNEIAPMCYSPATGSQNQTMRQNTILQKIRIAWRVIMLEQVRMSPEPIRPLSEEKFWALMQEGVKEGLWSEELAQSLQQVHKALVSNYNMMQMTCYDPTPMDAPPMIDPAVEAGKLAQQMKLLVDARNNKTITREVYDKSAAAITRNIAAINYSFKHSAKGTRMVPVPGKSDGSDIPVTALDRETTEEILKIEEIDKPSEANPASPSGGNHGH